MIRLFVIVLATIGGFILLGHFFPSLRTTAFALGTFGVTWLMLLTIGVSGLAYKVTK